MTTPSPLLVLVRTRTASNLGSAARVAKNFGVRQIAVVEPAVLPDEESGRLAAGADDLLVSISRHASLTEAVAGSEIVVTTSSLRGRGRTRTLSLPQLPGFLAEAGAGARIAFVFGPERSGLTEDELARASACVRLPTDPEFPTLNLSHAVAIVLAVTRGFSEAAAAREPREPLASAAEIEAALAHWDEALEAIAFYDTGHRDRSIRDWRRLVAGRPLRMREVAMLRGVANRILVTLKRSRLSTLRSAPPR